MHNFKPKMFFMSETRTIEEMTVNELAIDKYDLIRVDSVNRHTGGVAVYVHESVKCNKIWEHTSNNIWGLSIKVHSGYLSDTFSVIYRGHASSAQNFNVMFQNLCDSLIDNSASTHFFGDFNYDLYGKDVPKELIKITKNIGLKQLVNKPTREVNGSSTLIDWCLSNKPNVTCDVINDNLIADHIIYSEI
jgi:hypothetical protein